jgi:lambda family phage minor tail protein L
MSGQMSGQVAAEVQKLATDALVHLYTLDTTPIGGTLILRWTPSLRSRDPDNPVRISFQGNEYNAYPIAAEGFEWRGKGPAPRPRITVSNIGNAAGAIIVGYNDLVGAKITRLRTFAMFLDGEPGADPTSYIEPDVWFVERKVSHSPLSIEWELSNILDQQGKRLPGRQCLRDICTQVYRNWNPATNSFDYTGVTCPYVDARYYTEDGLPTIPSLDKCGKGLDDCKQRFPTGALPTWAFPGLARVR